MIARLLYTFFWLYLLNPLVVAIVLTGVLAHCFPTWTYLLVVITVAISILWYHIWMWVRGRT